MVQSVNRVIAKQGANFGYWIVIAVAAAAYVAMGIGIAAYDSGAGDLHWHTLDDAMINQRVAFMIHEIARPYFNEGEAVAATTSLVWPAIISVFYVVVDHGGAVVANILLSIALTIASAGVAVTIVPAGIARNMALIAILCAPGFVFFGPSGWEHIPQAFLLTLAFAYILRESDRGGRLCVPTRAVVLAAISFLLRGDSAITILVIGLAWAFTDHRYRRPGTYLTALFLLSVPLLYFGAMMAFYGEPVPNTVHLKVGGIAEGLMRGLSYLHDLRHSGHVPILLMAVAGFALFMRRGMPGLWLVLCAASLHVGFVVLVGGDVFGYGRFFLIYLPILTAAVVAVPVRRYRNKPWLPVVGVGLLLATCLYLTGATALIENKVRLALVPLAERQNEYAQQIRISAEIKNRLKPSDGSIGLHYLGIGYHLPKFHIADFLGKAEPNIARSTPRFGPVGHNKWDYRYIFETYNIAAAPMPQDAIVRVEDPTYRRTLRPYLLYWEDGVVEMKSRGYVFIPPSRFGNAPGGFGLYVRPDLALRFR